MSLKIVWVIGNDYDAPFVIHHLDDENIQVASSHKELANNDVQIISTCESLDLKPDAIVLLNFRLNYVNGTVNLNEAFFRAHDCPYYIFAHTANTLWLEKKLGLKFITLRSSQIGKDVYAEAIGGLIIKALIENYEILLKDLTINVLDGHPISSYLTTRLKKVAPQSEMIAKEPTFTVQPNVIIVPSNLKVDLLVLKKWSLYQSIIINLLEDNTAFSVISKGRIQQIYTLRNPKYGLQSYAYALSTLIKQDILGG